MKNRIAELLHPAKALLGEGAIWDEKRSKLWWVDILQGHLHCFDPKTGVNKTFEIGVPVGAVALAENNSVILAVQNGFARFDIEEEVLSMLVTIEHDNISTRFNDGKCDPQGRFWAGTLAQDGTSKAGSLFCLESDLSVVCKISGVGISNGLGWSPLGDTMYYIDSHAQNVVEYVYTGYDGSISSPRTVIEIEEKTGTPDGMCVDVEGMLWVAIWNGGKVIRIDPKAGKIIEEVVVPGVTRVTSCALGGESRKTLFVTTAQQGSLSEKLSVEKDAGSIFAVKVDVAGISPYLFQG